jgi:hypothetical protein
MYLVDNLKNITRPSEYASVNFHRMYVVISATTFVTSIHQFNFRWSEMLKVGLTTSFEGNNRDCRRGKILYIGQW